MDALLLIDIQNDFVEGGALAVPDGNAVVEIANKMMKYFDIVFATQDWHPIDHQSFASQHDGVEVGDVFDLDGLAQIAWPDHCVQGTEGAEFVAGLDRSQFAKVVQKGTNKAIDSYSGFFDNGKRHSTGLTDELKSLSVDRVFVMGLATDYCVKFSALDAVNEGFDTILIQDGCRGVNLNPSDVSDALELMFENKIKIVPSTNVPNYFS